jgi:cullin-4
LLRTIQSLTSGNAKVLKKEPAGKEVAKTDSFSFASGFTGKKVRLKINQLQMKETV